MGWQTTRRLPTHRCRCDIEPCVLGDDEIPVSNIEYGQHGNVYVNRLNKISITSCIIMMSIIKQLFLLTLSICKNYIIDIFLTLFYLNQGTVKQQKKNKTDRSTHEPSFTVGDIVYVYRPVVTPGRQRPFIRPWVGTFYIAQKLSPLHVKIRRKSVFNITYGNFIIP
jgi:hypothetical protein